MTRRSTTALFLTACLAAPLAAQARLFEKFFSLERPSTGRKGSGLGLSFVQEVMTLHGGRVAVESPLSPRGGTRVSLIFPRRGR